MEQQIVQILVVVAYTKVRSFGAEDDKGSLGSAFRQGLVGPKNSLNRVKGNDEA